MQMLFGLMIFIMMFIIVLILLSFLRLKTVKEVQLVPVMAPLQAPNGSINSPSPSSSSSLSVPSPSPSVPKPASSITGPVPALFYKDDEE